MERKPFPKPQYMDTRQTVAFLTDNLGLPIAEATLHSMVTRGNGPPYRKWGTRRVYDRGDVLAWAEAKLGKRRGSSSEEV